MRKLFVVALLLAAIGGCRHRGRAVIKRRPQGQVIHVPRATAPITIDGDLEEPSWAKSGRSGAFRDGAAEARPYSDARFLWEGDTLYIGLYAADEDIRATMTAPDSPLWTEDSFHMVFGTSPVAVIDVSPRGVVTDAHGTSTQTLDYGWSSGARVGVDADGTLNDPSDDDEEWVVELAVPLAALGAPARAGESIPLSVKRCDQPKHAPTKVCGATQVVLVLD